MDTLLQGLSFLETTVNANRSYISKFKLILNHDIKQFIKKDQNHLKDHLVAAKARVYDIWSASASVKVLLILNNTRLYLL